MRIRRPVIAMTVVAVAVVAAAGAVWIAKRTVRWNDARTMPPPLAAAVSAYGKGDDVAGLDAIHTLLHRYKAPAWEPRARVLAATRLARAGRERDIPDVLPKGLAPTDPLASQAQLLRARGWLARGEAARAAELARPISSSATFPFADDARLVVAAALDALGQWNEALATLDAAPGPSFAIAAARIAAAHADRDGVRNRLVAALFDATGAEDAEALRAAMEELLPDVSSRFTSGERGRLPAAARAQLEDGHAQTALELLDLVRPAGRPFAQPPGEALVEAEALLKLGRVGEARAAAARARLGDASTQDGARYVEARISAAQGRYGTYRAGLEALASRGRSPWKERALLDLAKTIEGVPSAATLAAYRRYRLAAGASASPHASLREGWAAYELGRFAEADAAFARALVDPGSPDGVRVTAMYWRARIAEQTGHEPQAREALRAVVDGFETHYYGLLAGKRLGLPLPAAPADAPPVNDPAQLGAKGQALAAARMLVSVGLWDGAAPYYRAAAQAAGAAGPKVALEAAAVAQSAAALSDAVRFAQLVAGDRDRTRAEDLPLGLWRLLYPAPSADAITRAAKENGLDPNLVAAVALQESAFNPVAVSGAGARGLLQVMPAVGAELAASLGLKGYDAADLFDPDINLRLGCAHLREYLRRFGSVPKALAAYNGGPARVERWKAATTKDDERFVERIPIPETRLYVKRVLAGARLYAVAWPNGLGVD